MLVMVVVVVLKSGSTRGKEGGKEGGQERREEKRGVQTGMPAEVVLYVQHDFIRERRAEQERREKKIRQDSRTGLN